MEKLIVAIKKSWIVESSLLPKEWFEINPARGQCAVTALIVQDYLGGDILKSDVLGNNDSHFYNKLKSEEILDLTSSQFAADVIFETEKLADRNKILSWPGTRKRYELLRKRVWSVILKQ